MDLWNWDEASLQEVPPGDKLTGLGKLLWLGTKGLLAKTDNLNSIPWTHKTDGEN